MKTRKSIPYIYVSAAFLLVMVFVYFPIMQNFYYSFLKLSSYSENVTFMGLANYKRLFVDPIFYIGLRNNILYAVISIIFQVGIGLVLAMLLESKYVGSLRGFFRSVFFVPCVISIAAVGLLWQFIYNPEVGLLNNFLKTIGLEMLAHPWLGDSKTAIYSIIGMSQWQWTGYIVMLFIVAIQKIPVQLYEAADIDGASGIQKALTITIPQVKEMTLVTSVITVIGSFKVFTEVYTMTLGGPGNSSHVLGTYLYETAFLYDELGYASTIGAIIFIITLATSILQITVSKSGEA